LWRIPGIIAAASLFREQQLGGSRLKRPDTP